MKGQNSMLNIVKKIIGTKNDREIKRLKKIVNKINLLEEKFIKLTDDELKYKTIEFKERLKKGETLEEILIEAFSVVREAAKRTIGMRHYDVQLLGGIVLFEGKISEMKTGEGKTLVATCPMYLNALERSGVHIITVNDYLAVRDREIMKPLFDFLGVTTGVILNNSSPEERKLAYDADITYGTTAQFGFDYLRDNMVQNREEKVQRGFSNCIIDEIDSVLIDEARTPLIISGANNDKVNLYILFRQVADILERSYETEKLQQIDDLNERGKKLNDIPEELRKDYEVNEKDKNVILTEKGIKKVESLLQIENLYSTESVELTHYLKLALYAKELYRKDKEYIVKDNKIAIIDTFTGRIMDGRHFGDGLHQAIEAKEELEITEESETIASITIQNYFKMYKKLSGMTGTGETEIAEFVNTYNLNLVIIPTNKPVQRKDHADILYRTHEEKLNGIVNKIKEIHKKGQPILVGTSSIQKSEELSQLLKENEIEHSVLNAKYHNEEADIIAQAGRFGAVTIATNMAGRGTDILLGGNPEKLAMRNSLEQGEEEYQKSYEKYKKICEVEKDQVKKSGGLFILGTERHESRRIDNQLIGRAGRQGDVGESQFFLSFEDEIMGVFGSEYFKKLVDKFNFKPNEEILHPTITKTIEKIQQSIENRNFTSRKRLFEYDEIINMQRKSIYENRDKILSSDTLKSSVLNMLREVTEKIVRKNIVKDIDDRLDVENLVEYFNQRFQHSIEDLEEYKSMNIDECVERIYLDLEKKYFEKESSFGVGVMPQLEKYCLLTMLDKNWRNHIKELDDLKSSIHLRSYAQKNPVIEYKILAGEIFQEMISNFKEEAICMIFGATLKVKE